MGPLNILILRCGVSIFPPVSLIIADINYPSTGIPKNSPVLPSFFLLPACRSVRIVLSEIQTNEPTENIYTTPVKLIMFADNPAFLTKIVENPADDTPRLVYCDWLEERGDELSLARATFIRYQIACFQMEQNPDNYNRETEYCGMLSEWCRYHPNIFTITREDIYTDKLEFTFKSTHIKKKPKESCNYHKMLAHSRKLQDKYWKYWIGSALTKTLNPTTLEPEDIYDFGFQRGFVHELVCPPDFWFEHHKELCAEQPIVDIVFHEMPEYLKYLSKNAPQGIEITNEMYLQAALEIRFPGKKFRLDITPQIIDNDDYEDYDTDLEFPDSGPIDSEDM